MDLDLDALRQTFAAEAKDQLDELEEALIDLEVRPDDLELVQRLFRVAHTFKGNAGSLGFHALGKLGHALEDVLEDIDRHSAPATGAVVSLLLEVVDAARRMLPEALAGADAMRPAHEEILRQLNAQRYAEREGPTSAPVSDASPENERLFGAGRTKTVRVAVEKLDRMVNLIGEIAVERSRIEQQIRALGESLGRGLRDDIEALAPLYTELEEAIRNARMAPIGPLLRQYARMIRDVAHAHGKLARLIVEGGDVEVDTAVIERLRDPLTHMIRNAIAHGIESPEVRGKCGKTPYGTIALRASYDQGGIKLELADDGAGMSRTRIAARARAGGRSPEPSILSDQELFRRVFEPGFSTALAVSDLSGRGVGLDVVRRSIEALHGSIHVETSEGSGTSFTIRLPLTLALIEGLSIGTGGESYVIPLNAIVECFELPRGELPLRGGGVINLRGRALPCVRLRDLVGVDGHAPSEESVVVVAYKGRQAGLVVDVLQGVQRTVIRPLGQLFRRVSGVAGCTLLGDGRVALILEVATLLGEIAPTREHGPPDA